MSEARIQHFYDERTGTLSYVVADGQSGHAAIVDPVIGYSASSGRLDTAPSDVIIEYVHKEKLGLEWVLETHAHADHLTGAQYIKSRIGGRVAIGEGICKVQSNFAPIFNLGRQFTADGHQFDRLLADGERFTIGALECEVMATPGHTSDSVSYRVGNAVFVGDSLFMPDYGTARCDFPGGNAELLYDSIQRLLSLPGDTQLYMCHDYKPGGRKLRWKCSVDEQCDHNIHVNRKVGKTEFAKMRRERDATLDLPALIVPAIQVNIRGGHLPDAEDNGIAYIKTPIDTV